jgi:hypothetical protein
VIFTDLFGKGLVVPHSRAGHFPSQDVNFLVDDEAARLLPVNGFVAHELFVSEFDFRR